MKKLIAFCLLYLSFEAYSQNVSNEKLIDWIFPNQNNYSRFREKDMSNGSLSGLTYYYYKISENLIGMSIEIDEMNVTPESRLFEINEKDIKILKMKTSGFGDMGGDEYSFEIGNNEFVKLPELESEMFWEFSEANGNFYECKSFWKIDKTTYLIVERKVFDNIRKENLIEKRIGYYEKGKGLIKEEIINNKTRKLSDVMTLIESGFDKELKIFDFNISLDLVNNENKMIENSSNLEKPIDEKNKIFLDGTIPKSFKVKLLIDKGLPYLVKDTIVLYNKKGIIGITPKLMKNGALMFDGKSVIDEEYSVKEMTIIETKYYKSPFCFKYKMYYSDGESNFRNVKIKDFNLTFEDYEANKIRYKISDWYEYDKVKIEDEIDKNSETYKDLLKKVKSQCFVFVIEYTDENDLKYRDYISLKIN